jgi:hypothetical protein
VAAPGTAHRPSPAAAGPGFRLPARADRPKGHIAVIAFFARGFVQNFRDPAVKVVLGLQQQLRKIIKNRKKIRKTQNQFCCVRGEEIYLC